MMGSHVLVTGGAGYLGSVVVTALLALGHKVRVLDLFTYGEEPLAPVRGHSRLRVHRQDIATITTQPEVMDEVDTVVQLAGLSNEPTCALFPDVAVATNHHAVVALARCALASGVRRFVFASNGDGRQYRPLLHVRDATDAILRVLAAEPATAGGEILNVGGDDLNGTVREIAEQIRGRVPRTPTRYQPEKADAASYRVGFAKIRERLAFVPRLTVRDAVDEIGTAARGGALGTMDDDRYDHLAILQRGKGSTAP